MSEMAESPLSNERNACADVKLIPRMALNDNKAGMQGLDKEKINKIIMENTVGSRYYKNQQKRDKQVQARIAKMKHHLSGISDEQKTEALKKADEILSSIEKDRELSRTIIHIDMDAFYASVEERDKPELKDKPMAVGGMSMLSTSNYIARRFGVRAAMPGFIAKKLCPELVLVPANFDKYRQVSHEVQEIFREYDNDFAAMSLDEAYLDITEYLNRRILMSEDERTFQYNPKLMPEVSEGLSSDGAPKSRTFGFSAEEVTQEIRFRIHQKTLLTASAGIGPNTMLSKIGSDLNKPNGQTYFKPCRSTILEFMKELPIRKVNGIGKVSEQLLSALGIKKCGDVYDRRADLVLMFSAISYSFFFRTALGCSSTHLETDGERKSISTESTNARAVFERFALLERHPNMDSISEATFNNISDPTALHGKLIELCQQLANDMKKRSIQGRTVVLKIKTVDFESHTRSKSTNVPLSNFQEIMPVAKELLKNEIQNASGKLALRLMGVGMSKLEPVSSSNQATILKFFKEPKSKVSNESQHCVLTPDIPAGGDSADTSFPEEQLSRTNEIDDVLGLDEDSSSREADSPDMFPEIRGAVDATERADLSRYSCPMCSASFGGLPALNVHVDRCLESETASKRIKLNDNAEADVRPGARDEATHPAIASESGCRDLTCPICRVVYDSTECSLARFNAHVDTCLNRGTIKSMLQDDAAAHNNNYKRTAKAVTPKKNRRGNASKFHKIDKFFC